MEFKMTIAAIAITASSVFARPLPPTEIKTICLPNYSDSEGVAYAGNCDQARNNVRLNRPLLANGCAEDQIAITATKRNGNFNVEVNNCLPPNIVQL